MSKTQAKTAQELTGDDLRNERHRYKPKVTQEELAKKSGFYYPAIPGVENGDIPVTQEQLQKLIAAVREVVADRGRGEK
jgi:predicted transcriptional regulator